MVGAGELGSNGQLEVTNLTRVLFDLGSIRQYKFNTGVIWPREQQTRRWKNIRDNISVLRSIIYYLIQIILLSPVKVSPLLFSLSSVFGWRLDSIKSERHKIILNYFDYIVSIINR